MNIGNIYNYYGGLSVKAEDGKYFWGIENYDGTAFDEIPKELYYALVKYEAVRKGKQAQPAQQDSDKVICPSCCHQFRAIPENVQQLMLDAGFEPPFTQPAQQEPYLVQHMVNRFLGWKLPQEFAPDGSITFHLLPSAHRGLSWPVGTNLFTAEQAKAMFEYCLEGAAPQPAQRTGDCKLCGHCAATGESIKPAQQEKKE